MSSTPARKMNPIEKEAEKRVYVEIIKSANTTTTKEVIAIFALLGIGTFAIYLINKYTNIKVDSMGFLLPSVLLFFGFILWYANYVFKKRKNHYLKILRRGYDTGQSSQSAYSSEQSKSLQRKAEKEALFSLLEAGEKDRSDVEEFMKKTEESLKKNKDKFTIWNWMILLSGCLFLLFAVFDVYMGAKIFEPANTPILSALAIIFFFGLLMATVTNAQKGRVRPFHRRSIFQEQWVRKAKNPKTFFCILSIRLVATFAACIGSVYVFLNSVF